MFTITVMMSWMKASTPLEIHMMPDERGDFEKHKRGFVPCKMAQRQLDCVNGIKELTTCEPADFKKSFANLLRLANHTTLALAERVLKLRSDIKVSAAC